MLMSDWVTEAAERIWLEQQRSFKGKRPSCSRIVSIIREHCPFKPDTVYVEAEANAAKCPKCGVLVDAPAGTWCADCTGKALSPNNQ